MGQFCEPPHLIIYAYELGVASGIISIDSASGVNLPLTTT